MTKEIPKKLVQPLEALASLPYPEMLNVKGLYQGLTNLEIITGPILKGTIFNTHMTDDDSMWRNIHDRRNGELADSLWTRTMHLIGQGIKLGDFVCKNIEPAILGETETSKELYLPIDLMYEVLQVRGKKKMTKLFHAISYRDPSDNTIFLPHDFAHVNFRQINLASKRFLLEFPMQTIQLCIKLVHDYLHGDWHEFFINLPNATNSVTTNKEQYYGELHVFFQRWNRILKSNPESIDLINTFYDQLQYSNFREVRTGSNNETIEAYIERVHEAITTRRHRLERQADEEAVREGTSLATRKIHRPWSFLGTYRPARRGYPWEIVDDLDNLLSIGIKTRCCFKVGGLAERMVWAAHNHPLSAIVQGKYRKQEQGKEYTWFSYLWEALFYDEKQRTYYPWLVMDNIESNNQLDLKELNSFLDYIKENTPYRGVYIGYLRNDLTEECNKFVMQHALIKKTNNLVFREANFYTAYDDSAMVHPIEFHKPQEQEFQLYKEEDLADKYRAASILGDKKLNVLENWFILGKAEIISYRTADRSAYKAVHVITDSQVVTGGQDTVLSRENAELLKTYIEEIQKNLNQTTEDKVESEDD